MTMSLRQVVNSSRARMRDMFTASRATRGSMEAISRRAAAMSSEMISHGSSATTTSPGQHIFSGMCAIHSPSASPGPISRTMMLWPSSVSS